MDVSNFHTGDNLPKGQEISVKGDETLRLAGQDLDLSSPEIQARLKAMKDGETLTIGREVR